MKIAVFISIFFLISCNSNKNIVILDQYFADMYLIDVDTIDNQVLIVELNSFNIEEIVNYKKIIVSPLIFNFYKDELYSYNFDIEVLGIDVVGEDLNGINIPFDSSNAYSQLVKIVESSNEYNKISVLIDYEARNKSDEVKILKKLESNKEMSFLLLNKSEGRSSISKFIKNNDDTDLWIIDSKKYGLYIYELLENEKIILNDCIGFDKINDNIIYSIEVDMNSNIESILTGNKKIIELKLKKH